MCFYFVSQFVDAERLVNMVIALFVSDLFQLRDWLMWL